MLQKIKNALPVMSVQLLIVTATSAKAAVWDDASGAIVDAMYGNVATSLSIIFIAAAVIASLAKQVKWTAIPGTAAVVSVYWCVPAIVTWAKGIVGA